MNVQTQASRRLSVLTAAATVSVLAACASPRNSVYFITKTSTSLIDAETVPAGISIGYDRVEGYAGPRYADGSVFPVASSIESKGEGPGRQVWQTFATGNAALIVTEHAGAGGKSGNAAAQDKVDGAKDEANKAKREAAQGAQAHEAQDERRKAVFFGTTTSVGVKLSFEPTSPLPNGFTLGYKRKELAIIPVDQHRQNTSVLGSFTNSTGVAAPPAGAASSARARLGFDVQQYFATGKAAEQLAALTSIKEQFRDNAEQAMGPVAQFRVKEANQGRLALDALACAQKLFDTQLERVLANAEALGMFGQLGGVAAIRVASTDTLKRQRYVAFMRQLDPADAVAGQRLALHQTTLCEWANPKK